MGSLCFTLLDDDIGHLISLPLSTDVGAESLLAELQGTFILRNSQQFHRSFFIRGEADDFSDQVSNEFVVLQG